MERYDVLVVGAGVVGCAAAYYLAQAGMRVALVDKGRVAGEASQAGAGLLAPLTESAEITEQEQQYLRLSLAGLRYFDGLDQQLQQETGIDIELLRVPMLRLAFNEHEVAELQAAQASQQHLLPGLAWLEGDAARAREPLLPPTVLGALVSPAEWNVQVTRLTLAYARGAALHGAHLFEGRAVGRIMQQGQRVVGVETEHGPLEAENVVMAAGAWAARWHTLTATPSIFPVKGQILALQTSPDLPLRHTIGDHKTGYLIPKADGSIYVGATVESAGFDKTVTIEGIEELLAIVAKIAPQLRKARFERVWAGLRPGSADGFPLIGPSRRLPGLWVAGGHYRNGILLGPVTGHILSELIQGRPVPLALDLNAFDPDRFGGWDGTGN